MKFKMEVKERKDSYGDVSAQTLTWNYDGIQGYYHVNDLCDCPEDAIIGRDLFSVWDFINAVELGMGLAAKGYTGIEVEEKEYEDE